MFETVVCPNCRRTLQLPPEHMGKNVQCPTCETTFIAGQTPPRPAPPPPTPEAVTQKRSPERPGVDDERRQPRRSRRPETSKPPTSKKPWQPWQIGLLIVGAVVLGGGMFVVVPIIASLNRGGPKKAPIGFEPPQNFQVAEPPPPVDVPDRMLTPAEQQDHARLFFGHFSGVMRNQFNQAGEKACIDSARLVNTAFEQKLIPAARQAERARLQGEFERSLAQIRLYHGDHWGNYEIKTVKQPRVRELIVVTRHPNPATGTALRLRWWLAHRDGRWWITEMEDIDFGLRLSMMLAGSLQPADPAVRTLCDAGNAMMLDNFDDADRILGAVRADAAPKACAATHHLLIASIRLRQRRFDEALTACTAAERCDGDMPGNDYCFAIAYNTLRRDPRALKHARAAQAWLGDDPIITYEIGLALAGQNRIVEAAASYRKALDAQPNHKDAFISLLHCIGPGVNNDDIAARFLKMPNPENHFQEFANARWQVRDTATLKILANAMASRLPTHADAHFFLALAHAEEEHIQAALASFRMALQWQNFEGRRDFYYTEFARTIVFRDQALLAYSRLADRQRAFRVLGEELRMAYKLDDLQQLVDLHVKVQPNDAYVHLFRAELHLRDEQYAQADQAFAKAFAAINDPAVEDRYRYNRLRARYQMGDIVGAYRDIGPQRVAFQQLADMCWFDKKMAALKTLVDAHAEKDALDSQLQRYQWRLDIHEKRFDAAAKLFRTSHAQAIGVDAQRRVLENFLFDMIDAGQAIEAYRRAIDPHLALDILAMDLGGGPGFDAVLADHRKAFPNDPLLHMYAGQQAANKQDWAKAAAEYSAGWTKLADAPRQRWAHPYLFARCKLGQAVQAYRDTGRRTEHFRQLTTMLLADKQIDAFEQLLAEHRPQRGNDPEFAAYEARLKILRGKALEHAEAANLLLAVLKDRPFFEQQRIGDSFLGDLAPFDVAAEAYMCIPDKRDAFSHMVWRYRQPERVKELARLIAAHAKQMPDDPRLAIETGELHFLQGDFALAERQFVLAKTKNPQDYSARAGLVKARIKLGKAAETYRELGTNLRAFQEIANQCVMLKDGVQLERLLAEHRRAHPAAKQLVVWDLEVHWQKKEYEAVVKSLQADRNGLLKNPSWRWKCESYLVRGLVRLKKSKEAIQEAETITQRTHTSHVLLALAVASTGDVPRFLEYLETRHGQRFFVEDCYRDEDLGPLLRSDAFRAVQDRYPPPPALPFPGGRFDDDWD